MGKGGLGRGLNSFFDTAAPAEEEPGNIEIIKLSRIEPNKGQPRQQFDDEKIEALADSIKEHGVIQPIIVVKRGSRYKIVAGERRWRAAKKAGLTEMPAVIKDYSDKQIAEIALIENLQRENLNPIEEALGYQTLINKFDMTQEEVSSRIGKSRSAVANSIRLLALDEPIRSKLISGEISSGHARALLSIDDSAVRLAVLESIIEKGLNVRQAEALSRQLQKAAPKKKKPDIDEQLKAELDLIENDLSSRFGTKVRLIHKGKSGKIEIEYFGNEDLERILDLINN